MKLFFETAGQAQRFLSMVPLGFVLALCLDADAWAGRMRPLVDCLLLLLAGWMVLCYVTAFGENGLRAYLLLGLVVGAMLYMQGIGKAARMIRRCFFAGKQEKDG